MSIIKPTGRFRGQEIIDANRKHLEPDEVRRLFAVLKEPLVEDGPRRFSFGPFWHGYFAVQYYFGCRVSEVALLLKEDVSFKTGEILIRRLKKRQFKKAGDGEKKKVGDGFSESVYGMTPQLAEAVQGVLNAHKALGVDPKNPWLFGSASSRALGQSDDRLMLLRRTEVDGKTFRAIARDTADNRFRQAATCARVPKHLRHTHTLRHTRATLALAEGMAEEDVKFLLGHSRIETTRGYLGVAKSLRLRLQTRAEQVTGLFG
jgi:integrase